MIAIKKYWKGFVLLILFFNLGALIFLMFIMGDLSILPDIIINIPVIAYVIKSRLE